MRKQLANKYSNEFKRKKILSLDGGGVRGALTLGYLEQIEKLLRDREKNESLVLADYYDLIGGTSTGAIIAACLSKGMSVQKVIELYKSLGVEVFGKKNSWLPRTWTTCRSILKSTYKTENIERVLKKELGETTLGDYDDFCCPVAIFAKRADTFSLWMVSNHKDGIYSDANAHLKLWELCRASSAAPYYFQPKAITIQRRNKQNQDAVFIDGGVSLANNPALQLFLVVTIPTFGYQWSAGEDNLFITSLGTGSGVSKDPVEDIVNRRAIEWVSKIPDLFMTDAQEMSQVFLQLFGNNLGSSEKIDSQLVELEKLKLIDKKLFTFTRFNVEMTSKDLAEKYEIKKTDAEVYSLLQMDYYENIDELLEIGRTASAVIADKHLPI